MSAFDRLLEQIDSFIRKYYKNEMLKGLLLFALILISSFLLFTTLEYFGRFNSTVRAVFFFTFIGLNLFVLVRNIFIPLLKLSSFGSRINRYQASGIIGSFFPEISDRLLNTLQLGDSLDNNVGNFELIRASVAQRSQNLSAIPFSQAVDVSERKKYARYLLPTLLLLIGIMIFVPAILRKGSEHIMYYSQTFVDDAPFEFVLYNTDLSVEEGSDLKVSYKLKGSDWPEKVYITGDQGRFLMTRDSKNTGSWTLKNVQSKTKFYFEGNGFESKKFTVVPIPKSSIGKLQAKLAYPAYLGKTNETIDNVGDLTVPEGTRIEWSVLTKNTGRVDWYFNDSLKSFSEPGFKIEKRIFSSLNIKLNLINAQTAKVDSNSFKIHVIKDNHPTIFVEEIKDTTKDGLRFFGGSVSDDYGLSSLKFVYKISSADGSNRQESMKVTNTVGTMQNFDFAVDFRKENVKIDDKIEYYFIVSDNDGIHGPKSTKSQTFVYKLPSLEELNENRDNAQNEVRSDLSDVLKRTEEFKKNVNRLKKETLNSKSSDWNKKNQLNQLKEEQMSLQKELERIQNKMEQSIEEKNQLSPIDEELLMKQQLIEDLLNEVMDEELRDLLDRLQELMEKNNQKEFQEKMDDLEMSAEDMNKQLDRSLEMLKKLQVNEKIDALEEELKKLADEQRQLAKDEQNQKISDENAAKKQEEINSKFEELKDDLKKLNELNEELQRPMELGDQEEEQENIDKDLKDAKEALDKKKSDKAQPKQNSAAEEMEKMAEELNSMQNEANQQQQGEDIEMLRQILQNLMALSFDQEMLMKKFNGVGNTDPAYTKYGRKQRAIIDDTKIVEDSLYALAKRQPKIAKFIDTELSEIRSNHKIATDDIDEHRRSDLARHQQGAMTGYNNLALLLNESLESMQQDMKSMMEGAGSCDNPGGKGKPKPGSGMSSGDMKQMLKKQLESMEKGSNEGGKKPGDKPGQSPGQGQGGENGEGTMGLGNKQIAKMAAEQSEIRRRLEQIRDELNKEGQGQGNKLNPLIKELEQQQKDIINKNFTPELINRQKEILTRMLESEKAIEERGFKDERESKEGKNVNNGNQIRFDQYNKQKLKQIELLRSVDPTYQKYYKDKANEYFNQAN